VPANPRGRGGGTNYPGQRRGLIWAGEPGHSFSSPGKKGPGSAGRGGGGGGGGGVRVGTLLRSKRWSPTEPGKAARLKFARDLPRTGSGNKWAGRPNCCRVGPPSRGAGAGSGAEGRRGRRRTKEAEQGERGTRRAPKPQKTKKPKPKQDIKKTPIKGINLRAAQMQEEKFHVLWSAGLGR